MKDVWTYTHVKGSNNSDVSYIYSFINVNKKYNTTPVFEKNDELKRFWQYFKELFLVY